MTKVKWSRTTYILEFLVRDVAQIRISQCSSSGYGALVKDVR